MKRSGGAASWMLCVEVDYGTSFLRCMGMISGSWGFRRRRVYLPECLFVNHYDYGSQRNCTVLTMDSGHEWAIALNCRGRHTLE